MKKTLINCSLVLVAIVLYYLQSNFFTWFNISGVMPNLFIVLVLFIGLFANQSTGTIYGLLIGIILDFLLGTKIGVNALALGIVGYLAGVFDKNFSKETKMTIIVMVGVSTVIYEIIKLVLNYMFLKTSFELFNFITILLIEILFNILLTIIIYPLIQNCGYFIENEFKGSKLLTRYF